MDGGIFSLGAEQLNRAIKIIPALFISLIVKRYPLIVGASKGVWERVKVVYAQEGYREISSPKFGLIFLA